MDRGGCASATRSTDGRRLEFSGIPRFAPEHFARIILAEPMKRKQLDTGLRQLTEEGAAQVFYTSGSETSGPTPIVGAVGMLQFDVMLHRLEHEYGAACRIERISARFHAG
jgi:peptide chain release factor 3